MPKFKKTPGKEQRKKWMAFFQALAPEVNPQAIHLMDEMRMVSHALYQIGELSVAATGLSYAKMRLLMGLLFAEEIGDRPDGLNPSEISDRQGTSRNTISALIRDLEEEGLVERSLDPEDRRRFNIRLTESGRELVHAHVSNHLRTVAGCFETLDEEEQAMLVSLLSKLGVAVNETKEEVTQATIGA